DWQPGKEFTVAHGWIEIGVGDMPLVISAPHGGTLEPEEISDRSCKGSTTVRDLNIDKLAFNIREELQEENGTQPSVVVARIARKKVDFNRSLDQATCGNETMNQTWKVYHAYIDSALSRAVKKYGYAIFIDLHGHGHKNQRLEIGYKPTKGKLKEMYLDSSKASEMASETSVANLLDIKDLKISSLLWGKNSFGTLMTQKGFAAVPSRDDPYPLKKESYFTGGYNTRRYTSNEYPNVFGWQIEANYKGVRDAEGRPKFAQAFAKAILTYINKNVDQ